MFAGSFFVALSLSAEVEARGSVPGAKADRADACSGTAWPYFEASCLRDARNPFGHARDVRLISHDEAAAAKVKGKPARSRTLRADGGLIAAGFALRARKHLRS
jgi:hypothetical protein